jgi:hypothetical protein
MALMARMVLMDLGSAQPRADKTQLWPDRGRTADEFHQGVKFKKAAPAHRLRVQIGSAYRRHGKPAISGPEPTAKAMSRSFNSKISPLVKSISSFFLQINRERLQL